MIESNDISKIKQEVEEFFEKMTMEISVMDVSVDSVKRDLEDISGDTEENKDVVNVNIKVSDPQILIGQQGQTLFEVQRLLRMILNKKLQKVFYLNLDINDYKNQKIGYLKDVAKDMADRVLITKEEKSLSPMSSYERRVIHSELSKRTDVITESRGEGFERHIVIRPR